MFLDKWWLSIVLFIIYFLSVYTTFEFVTSDPSYPVCHEIIERKQKCLALLYVYSMLTVTIFLWYIILLICAKFQPINDPIIIRALHLIVTTKVTTELFNILYFLHYKAPDKCSPLVQRYWLWCDSVFFIVIMYVCNEINKLRH